MKGPRARVNATIAIAQMLVIEFVKVYSTKIVTKCILLFAFMIFMYILVCLRYERILKAEIFAFIGHLGHMLKAVD